MKGKRRAEARLRPSYATVIKPAALSQRTSASAAAGERLNFSLQSSWYRLTVIPSVYRANRSPALLRAELSLGFLALCCGGTVILASRPKLFAAISAFHRLTWADGVLGDDVPSVLPVAATF